MDLTNNQLIVPYSSCSPSWDVVLSFYGKDTRSNFIANLYFALDQAGILTFRDDPALQKGQDISSGILSAIKDSKIFVVVISENYARSPWCLNELVEILSCKRTENQVIPVFYYVNPSDLRYQKGSFGEAFESHKNSQSVDMVEKWKSALAEIAKVSGYHLKKNANENEHDTVQEILQNVAVQVSLNVLHLEEFLCGTESAVEEIYQKLKMESNDVRAIGICGMGGIGKTTIAKAFYNKYSNKFDISCFIKNVKQNSQGCSSLLPLLEQLLIKLLRRKDYKVPDVESGKRQLKRILFSNKALIVLDNLDQSSYSELLVWLCNLFSAGSRIIITTRDANLLSQLKVDISEVDVYMVNNLGQIDSLTLFSHYAFGELMPPVGFRELSVSFVTYAGGLPLALKVLGSSLRGRTHVSFWEAKLEKVREIPEKDIQKIIQLSYDELGDETEKSIFLDIAFFFVGKDVDEAVHIFNSCGFFPEAGIPILIERCLLTIDEDNKFQMHNLIQEMGRELGNNRCLLWRQSTPEDLRNLEEIDKVEVFILDLSMCTKRHFSAEIFERLPNLRLLEIIDACDIKGSFGNSFHRLRCIRWHHCPWKRFPSSFRPQKLVSIDMQFSKLKTLWKGAMSPASLKSINVSYSMKLKFTPDFGDLKLVEKLVIRGCKSLLKVHPSIGQLTNLSHLDLGECDHLKELPEPIGQLTKLCYLDMHYCVYLKRLPHSIRQLTNISHLNIGGCRKLKQLPDQLGDIKGLKMLDVSYTDIKQLPDSIVDLKELVKLNLYSCKKLKNLPKHFGNMEGLRMFDASCSTIEQLPDSFVNLINMVDLQLSYCKSLTSLPNSIWKLKYLQVLNLRGNSKLEGLPEQLGKMQFLEVLNASFTAIEKLPDSIGLLNRLKALVLESCKKLKYLPNSIGNLASVEYLYLGNNNILRNLPDSVKNMQNLEALDMKCNIRLCLPIILNLSSLKKLHLTDEGEDLSSTEPFSLSKLSNLQDLELDHCVSHGSSFPELPLNLKQLRVYDHATLEQLPNLSSLKQLKKLYLQGCGCLQSIPLLPPHLQSLTVHDCTSLKDLPDLLMLKKLKTLSFTKCSNLKLIRLEQPSIQVWDFSSFRATLPNKEVPGWFSYKSSGRTLSLDIPPILGDNVLGVVLWIVFRCRFLYKCKNSGRFSYIRAVVTNKTESTTKNCDIYAPIGGVGELQSCVKCMWGFTSFVKSGDLIKVSFQRLLYSYDKSLEVVGGVKVEMCGAHLIQNKNPRV